MPQLLRPVGEKIFLPTSSDQQLAKSFKFEAYNTAFVDSGTSALGLALSLLAEAKPENKQVLIPAYCCPDILAAVLFNGLEPVCVDLEPNSTFLDLDKVALLLNKQTLAIVAINFLGIPERIEQLKSLALTHDAMVIEDSAQYISVNLSAPDFKGDMVVLSFGKGKPLSILGGGALLISDRVNCIDKSVSTPAEPLKLDNKFKLKVWVYNFILRPSIYWVLSKMPFLNIGDTQFHPLTNIRHLIGLDAILQKNFLHKIERDFKNIQLLRERIAGLNSDKVIDLSSHYNVPVKNLLRYPLLLKNKTLRDTILLDLNNAGVSATAMYKNRLFEVSGVAQQGFSDNLQGDTVATDFANRLLTIPSHSGLDAEWVEKVISVISRYA